MLDFGHQNSYRNDFCTPKKSLVNNLVTGYRNLYRWGATDSTPCRRDGEPRTAQVAERGPVETVAEARAAREQGGGTKMKNGWEDLFLL